MPKAPKKGSAHLRKERFSQEELQMLVDTLHEHTGTVFSSNMRREAVLRKKEIWALVCQKVSAVGNTPRTVKDCRKRWDDLRLRVQNILSANRAQPLETGGGPGSPIKLTPWEETCASQIGAESIEGVGEMECGATSSTDGDEVVVERLGDRIDGYFAENDNQETTQEGILETFKAVMRGEIIALQAQKQKERTAVEIDLESQFQETTLTLVESIHDSVNSSLMESYSQKIKANDNIQGLARMKKPYKMELYASDILLYMKNSEPMLQMMTELVHFKDVSRFSESTSYSAIRTSLVLSGIEELTFISEVICCSCSSYLQFRTTFVIAS
ncbi:nuclear apoptosis-inducing factor 1-like [Ambystoma mexicanum]|uniref:nuclear apoptosis-inducing factor 1-like n=1 Tax=Ambystoma mexicanum TaxID=8296 RepID=UPI0037E97581